MCIFGVGQWHVSDTEHSFVCRCRCYGYSAWYVCMICMYFLLKNACISGTLDFAFILCIIYLNMLVLLILNIIGCYLYLFSLFYVNKLKKYWQGTVSFKNMFSIIILCFPVYYTLQKCHLDFTIQLICWYQDLYGMGIIKVAFLRVKE